MLPELGGNLRSGYSAFILLLVEMNLYVILIERDGAVLHFFVSGDGCYSRGDEQQCDSSGYYQQVLYLAVEA